MAELRDEYAEAERLVARGREQRGAAEGLLQDARQLLGQTIASAQDAVDTVVQTVFGGDRTLAIQVPSQPPTPCRRPSAPRSSWPVASSTSCSPGSEPRP